MTRESFSARLRRKSAVHVVWGCLADNWVLSSILYLNDQLAFAKWVFAGESLGSSDSPNLSELRAGHTIRLSEIIHQQCDCIGVYSVVDRRFLVAAVLCGRSNSQSSGSNRLQLVRCGFGDTCSSGDYSCLHLDYEVGVVRHPTRDDTPHGGVCVTLKHTDPGELCS